MPCPRAHGAWRIRILPRDIRRCRGAQPSLNLMRMVTASFGTSSSPSDERRLNGCNGEVVAVMVLNGDDLDQLPPGRDRIAPALAS